VPRIVSLIASATEIICALGREDQLVGRSHECDFPESVKRLPVCTSTKFPTDGTSYQIDQRVKALVQEALSVYRVDGELLRELEPEVIVTQSHCEVCAVSLRDVERAVCAWVQMCPRIVSLAPQGLADVWDSIEQVAEVLGVMDEGQALIRQLTDRVENLTRQAQALGDRPTVACVEWLDPLMASGNWMPELVERAGGINLFGEEGKHAPWLTWEDLCARDPEVILLLPCGFDITRTYSELPVLTAQPGWSELRAVQHGRVVLLDGNAYFNRPGPRLVDSLEILCEVLHPQAFPAQHEGTGWRTMPRG
jgi:iron complex transport system substrate-binding protein